MGVRWFFLGWNGPHSSALIFEFMISRSNQQPLHRTKSQLYIFFLLDNPLHSIICQTMIEI